jgi:hypothetical protein
MAEEDQGEDVDPASLVGEVQGGKVDAWGYPDRKIEEA